MTYGISQTQSFAKSKNVTEKYSYYCFLKKSADLTFKKKLL